MDVKSPIKKAFPLSSNSFVLVPVFNELLEFQQFLAVHVKNCGKIAITPEISRQSSRGLLQSIPEKNPLATVC